MGSKGNDDMLIKNIFTTVSSRNFAIIFYAIALYPFLYLITLILPTNFMQIGGETNSLSGLEFYYGILLAQSQFAVPLILMTYFVSYLFFEEYESGRLIFYKDISRIRLYNSKLVALFSMYIIYYVILFVSSEFCILRIYINMIMLPVLSYRMFKKLITVQYYVSSVFFALL
ncbi:hypothetical protein [Staphylococcus sp. GDX8P102P-2]|uniref:hypothetical protein n=1 Tax=Staphylococcus sp. GDX8P102P-2 TaxID=2804106 RepID=UPI001FD9D70E|nr:hypothetical protein [Staphylococcus sp. GDX8P102P-2]